ncbi:MAG: Glutamyl-tRNA reductase [Syntrophorhabdus sp. PtaU1.Bin058]|nr:MAG: Glutamyl-tRNA reductase [Syntrophorhabdus sp. PtaU1.Bin058]
MQIVVFGLNHNTAPVEIREKLFLTESQVPQFFNALRDRDIEESAVLSTCNRTEIYLCTNDADESLAVIKEILENSFNIDRRILEEYTYTLKDESSYRHLFLVASGLDSMVVGEAQILGQVKDAYRTATHNNATGYLLNKLFHKTFNVAKRVRSETRIGYNPVSISSMAVELSKRIFGELHQRKVLVIGAGEMSETALRYLKKEGLHEIFIINRTFGNAKKLAEDIAGIPYPFESMSDLLMQVDMVLTSTGSEKPLIDTGLIVQVMKKRKNRPLFLVDIAVPRDVDPTVNKIENVYLYDIDDLKDLSQKHLSDRLKESEKALEIIDSEVKKFSSWLRQSEKNPLITFVIDKAEAIRTKEFKKTAQKLKNADEETLRSIDMLTRAIVKKLIHPHVALIKEDSDRETSEIIKRLFTLEEEDEKDLDNRDEGQ